MFKVSTIFDDGGFITRIMDQSELDRKQKMFKDILGSHYTILLRNRQFLALDGDTFIAALEWTTV